MELKELKESLEAEFGKKFVSMQELAAKGLEETAQLRTITGKTNEDLTKVGNDLKDVTKAIQELTQKGLQGMQKTEEMKTIGEIVTASEQYAAIKGKPNVKGMDAVSVPSFWSPQASKAIINAQGLNQPLVQTDRVPMVMPQLRRLTVRDLIPVATTDSNMIEYAQELGFANNAGPQFLTGSSPLQVENTPKPESDITFQLKQSPVSTIAHWIAASRQVLSDAGMLQGYIENRLTYGLKLEEEDELLNGSGQNGELTGLRNAAMSTAFNQLVTGDTVIDTILRAMLQVSLSEFAASGAVLNPRQWYAILLLKDLEGRYIFGDPGAQTQAARIWGIDVVPTQAMPNNNFLIGAFDMAAQIFDREQNTIRIAEQHGDFFIRNMVAILAEERIALAGFRPAAIVRGTFQ